MRSAKEVNSIVDNWMCYMFIFLALYFGMHNHPAACAICAMIAVGAGLSADRAVKY